MKKKKNKLSPDLGLAIEQYGSLNKNFYEGFILDFYNIKLINLLFLISNTDDFVSNIVDKKLKVERFAASLKREEIVNEDIKKYAKLEMAMTYYHCLETFIRLFLAHATLSGCPWLDLTRLTVGKYKLGLESLSKNNFKNLNKTLNENDTILYVLTGQTKRLEGLLIEDIEGLRYWISWSASQLLKTYDYNSFKHGLAISPKTMGLEMVGNENFSIKAQGEALEFISKNEKGNRYVWTKEIVWIPYDSRAAIISTVSNMIKNIMIVGKAIHLKESYKIVGLPKKSLSPEFLLKNDSNSIFKVTGFKMELLYYKMY